MKQQASLGNQDNWMHRKTIVSFLAFCSACRASSKVMRLVCQYSSRSERRLMPSQAIRWILGTIRINNRRYMYRDLGNVCLALSHTDRQRRLGEPPAQVAEEIHCSRRGYGKSCLSNELGGVCVRGYALRCLALQWQVQRLRLPPHASKEPGKRISLLVVCYWNSPTWTWLPKHSRLIWSDSNSWAQ